MLIWFRLATDTLRNNYKGGVKCWARKRQCFLGSEVGEPHCPTGATQGQEPEQFRCQFLQSTKGRGECKWGALAQSFPSLSSKTHLFSVLYEENRGPDDGSGSLKITKVGSGECFNS